jgi:hypothetical protein
VPTGGAQSDLPDAPWVSQAPRQQQNQPQRGGRRNDEPHQDQGRQQQGFAHGGGIPRGKVAEIGARFKPQMIGARKAKDGHWYVRDRSRPGKYLLVVFGGSSEGRKARVKAILARHGVSGVNPEARQW